MGSASCQFPGCDRIAIGICEDCRGHYCSRHLWQAWYGTLVALCSGCHQRLAALQRQRTRASAAYTAIVTLLFFSSAGISYSLHGLRPLDAELTLWMFWLSAVAFVLALGRLGVLLARL